MEWSEQIIAYLAITDYQEFIPLLMAAASSKHVIEKEVMFKGILFDLIKGILFDLVEEIEVTTNNQVKKEADRTNIQTEN